MGYSLSWAAVKNGSAEAVHSLLGLNATDAQEEIAESEIVGATLPTGWYLVLFHRKELDEARLEKLSNLGEVVYCFVEDHVMFSRASNWKDGECLWSLTHDCEKGRYHLDVKGVPPASLREIKNRLVAEQDKEGGEKADVDLIYDVPAELAKAITGFRHDQDMPGMKDTPFQVLEKKNLFSRFFRGKN